MTNVTIKKLTDTKRELTIKVAQDQIPSYRKKAYQKVGTKAKIPGFRAGKIPDSVLDRHYGAEVEYESLNFLVDDSYRQALQEHKLIPLLQPKFDVTPLIAGSDYQYKVEIEVKPEFELKDYKQIKLKDRSPKVEKSEVEKELNNLSERMAESVPAAADDALNDGFAASLDFVGKIDGTPFPGGTANDYMLNFGKGAFLKPFEEQIRGMKAGEERDIQVPFPADYFEKSLAGKTADFHVKIKALYKKVLPKLDDEFAKDVGKASLKELQDDIEKHILQAKKAQVRPEYLKEIREHVLKTYKFEVPQGLIDKQMEQVCQNHDHDHDHKDHKHPSREDIEKDLRFEFVLEAIALKEEFKPTPQEVHQHLAYFAQMYRKPIAEIQKAFLENGNMPHILARIVLDKTVDFIIENAKLS